jgi:DNA-binding transcriptional regulator YdaS (Cro superfamily)
MSKKEATIKAIELAGGALAVSLKMGISFQAVYKWRRAHVPACRALALSKLTHNKIKVEQLL